MQVAASSDTGSLRFADSARDATAPLGDGRPRRKPFLLKTWLCLYHSPPLAERNADRLFCMFSEKQALNILRKNA